MMDGIFAPPQRKTDPLAAPQLRNAEAALSQSLKSLQDLINTVFNAPAARADGFEAPRPAVQRRAGALPEASHPLGSSPAGSVALRGSWC